jgi:transglutaminase-like putative cysteine protease
MVALVALALGPLAPVFGPAALVRPALGGLALGAGVAALGAWRRWPARSVLAALAAAYLAAGPALAAPELAAGRWWPTWAAEVWLASGFTAVWRRLLSLELPLGPGGGFGLAPFLLAYLGAAAGVSLALRGNPARAGAAALVPLVVAGAAVVLGTRQTGLAAPLGLAGGAAGLVWAAWRAGRLQPRRVVALALTLALAGGAGLAAGRAAERRDRLVVRELVEAPFDPQSYPSPLAAYRRYIKAGVKGQVVLRAAGLPTGGVVKLAVMDRFDGLVWNVAAGGGAASGSFRRMAAPGGAPTAGASTAAAVTLQVVDPAAVWLYSVGQPQSVQFQGQGAARLREALRFNSATGAMALPPAPPAGLTYTLATRWAACRPAAEVIAQAEAGRTAQPAGVRVQSADLAALTAVRGAATGGAKALALEQFLQDGYYSDGQAGALEGAAQVESLAGHGADRIAQLLTSQPMVGNAEQYASAMALMARAVGLPARVVMGFAPGYGERAGAAGQRGAQGEGAAAGSHTFTGLDMTAWVEVELESLGWVAFFPTPNRQDSPLQADQRPDPQPRPQVVQPPPPAARASQPPSQDLAPAPVGSAQPVARAGGPARWGPAGAAGAAVGGLALLAGALAGARVGAKARRRRRRRLRGPPSQRIVAGWDEVADQLADLGLARPAAATRLELARAAAPAGAGAGLARLAAQSDAAAFGAAPASGPEAAAYWRQVEAWGRGLRAGLTARRRLRLALSARSLRAGRRAARECRGLPGSGTIEA